MAEVDFSPKPFSNLTWAVTLLKEPMNVIMVMNIINNKLGAFWCISTVHESHYSLVETSYGQLNIKAFTRHCPIIVVNRALMNIIKCCYLDVLTSLINPLNPTVHFWYITLRTTQKR